VLLAFRVEVDFLPVPPVELDLRVVVDFLLVELDLRVVGFLLALRLLDDDEDFDFDELDFLVDEPFLPFAPPVCLFTVAQPIRSASFSEPPRFLTLSSMCSAIRFCFPL
jgi:hypothetical protein